MKLTDEQRKHFFDMIHEIIESEKFRKMKEYKHHAKGNAYEHSIHVAYLCYWHWIKTGCDVDIKELVRGALLHDYFLYDWRENTGPKWVKGMLHGFRHPQRAFRNAVQDYADLSKYEEDIIKRHMFPLIPIPPNTKYGWIVCLYDKVAATLEYGCFRNIYYNWIPREKQ